jgi:4-carboxymuconolactone decarboxylase
MARMRRRYGTIAVALVAAALGWFAGHGTGIGPMLDPTSPAVGKEPRFPQLTMDQLNDAQRPLGEAIMKISAVGIAGPYNPMLRSPVFGQRMFDLLDYLRWHSSLPLRLNEFAILITGRLWRSQVEWYAHGPLALKAGPSPDIIADLKANRRPAAMKPDEAVVYDFIMELATRHEVSDETFARAKKLLGEQQVVDLTAVTGTYVSIAMLLAMAEEGVPPGKEPPFRPGDP